MIALPMPPSVNALFVQSRMGSRRGRAPSPQYVKWEREAGQALERQPWPECAPPYAVTIAVNIDRRGDIDNRVKPILDLLVKHGVIAGDQWVDALFVRRDRTVAGCTVHIESESGVAL